MALIPATATKRTSSRATPVMNVTPLVDVVLVLLIIFMVVIPAMQKGAQIDLPSIFHVDEESKGRADPVNLSLTRDGQIHLDTEVLAEATVEPRLREIHEAEPLRRVVLKGDRGVRYEEARTLFALCQKIGFPGVSLQVNERRDGAQKSAQNPTQP